ncbi:MAG: winged helix-turn-helix transcriptional regulator [Hahellaceae bacterium]|jgi:DNA-binding transcriptional ArsR family regulator|nr:winged helix-turn-helix transcriptional regulator [Hahellaceae bacterium]MCP5211250.1 winged helix-turn-helix transcriptional regulator [Hahellaceae bacterium]
MQKKELSIEALELVAYRFKLLGDPMRLKILHALQAGEKTVTELVKDTGTSQPNVSKHLAVLKAAGLVKRRQESNLAYFTIGAPFIFDLCNIVCDGISHELQALSSTFR